jgi:hypothetical protein
MAGYSLDFQVKASALPEAKRWLTFFKLLASSYGLDVTYRTRVIGRSSRNIKVAVDGKIWMIQHLDRRLGNEILAYLRAHGFNRSVFNSTILPFLIAHKGNVDDAADNLFRSVTLLEKNGAVVQTSPLSVSAGIQRISRIRRPRQPTHRAVKSLLSALDGWAQSLTTREQTVIAADQAIESWIKARCGLPVDSRKGMGDVLEVAVQRRIINKRQKARVLRYHRLRNKVQHRGRRVTTDTLVNMLDNHLKLIDLWLNPDVKLEGPPPASWKRHLEKSELPRAT